MVRNLGRYFRMLGLLVREDMKSKLANRAEFGLIVLGITAYSITSLFTIVLIFRHVDTLAGFGRGSLIFMQGFMMMSYALQSACFNYQWWVEYWVQDGTFLKYYLRPVHPIAHLALEGFHPQGLAMVAFGLAYCAIGLADSPDRLRGASLAFASIAFLALSTLIYLAINLIVTSAAFWIKYPYAITSTVARIMELAKYPQDLFPGAVRTAFVTVLPLAFVCYYPALAITEGRGVLQPLMWMTIAAAISFWLMLRMWKWGMSAYEGSGG